MSKAKAKGPQPQGTGLYRPESIRDVAESLGIANLPDAVASALASDVEYRIHQVIEESSRFTRHARRTTMTTSDVDQALRVMNIEPLYGHSPHNPPTFRRALPYPHVPAAGTVYFVEDEEIDFDRVLREEKIPLPKPTSWTAHWLAVEGVQPLVPENPPAIPRDTEPDATHVGKVASPPRTGTAAGGTTFPPTPPSPPRGGASYAAKKQQQQLVKQVLSRELQLYYTRLTTSLLPPGDYVKRTAALSSLRNDAGLQTLLPYLVKWVGDGVVGVLKDPSPSEGEGKVLEVLLDVIAALLDNTTLFVEPYLHQLLPPLLSILLHASLPSSSAQHLRTSAAQTLSHLLTQHATTYPSLAPRIMKTLLLALLAPKKSRGTREGAVRGLVGVGKEAVRKGLVEGGGAKVIGEELSRGESEGVVSAVMDGLGLLHGLASQPRALDPSNEHDAKTISELRSTLGDFFAERFMVDADWAWGVLHGVEGADS
ncbi:TAF-domain-containing protein [Rickenella mellea]|uniref:TBP-associated factor 6 n=1 Tax=Rickenella mellea TaxID=50990 RepID=A0A4R5XGB4_9AGAM|nr:TAF-domain-containing protein [Rickenella mellea]